MLSRNMGFSRADSHLALKISFFPSKPGNPQRCQPQHREPSFSASTGDHIVNHQNTHISRRDTVQNMLFTMMPAKELCYLFRVILRIYCFDGCVQNIVNCIYHVRSCCYVFHPDFRSFRFVRPQNAVKMSGALFMAKYVCQCLYQSDYITQICRFPSLSICFSSNNMVSFCIAI